MKTEVVETKVTSLIEELDDEELIVEIDHSTSDEDSIFQIYTHGHSFNLNREDMEKFSKVIKKALILQAK